MVDYIGDAGELVRRIRMFSFGGHAPQEIAEKLQTIPGSDADILTNGAEILYAHKDLLDNDGLALMAQLYYYADQSKWSTFNKDGRSLAIVGLVRRELGENGFGVADAEAEWPEPETNRRDGQDWREPEPSPAPAPAPAGKGGTGGADPS